MPTVEAVIFDFIGTLADVKGYTMDDSKKKLYKAVADAGFEVGGERFLEAYGRAHEKYRVVRYQKLVEVTNAVWISEALTELGFETAPEDPQIKIAVNTFFEEYVKSLKLRPCVRSLLKNLSTDHRLGLISNFTYAPVIFAGLRRLGINRFFNAVLVSEEVGWRKPSPKVFAEALERLSVRAEETVYVGDSPLEDVGGAKSVGMRTVFVSSQFYSVKDLEESRQKPDLVAKDICALCKQLLGFLNQKR